MPEMKYVSGQIIVVLGRHCLDYAQQVIERGMSDMMVHAELEILQTGDRD